MVKKENPSTRSETPVLIFIQTTYLYLYYTQVITVIVKVLKYLTDMSETLELTYLYIFPITSTM